MSEQKKPTTIEEIEKILAEYKNQPDIKIKRETRFDELELDSLDTVDLVMQIEDALAVTIEMNKEIQTVGHLVDIIDQQRKAE